MLKDPTVSFCKKQVSYHHYPQINAISLPPSVEHQAWPVISRKTWLEALPRPTTQGQIIEAIKEEEEDINHSAIVINPQSKTISLM